MSLIKAFRSRKFSRSFKDAESLDDDDDRRNGLAGGDDDVAAAAYGNAWSTMLPELLGEIIRRVEASEDQWPRRQNVVACACVCKRWRDITRQIVQSPSQTGKITFPSCLKQVLVVELFSFLAIRDFRNWGFLLLNSMYVLNNAPSLF